jgi:hypothetical protein
MILLALLLFSLGACGQEKHQDVAEIWSRCLVTNQWENREECLQAQRELHAKPPHKCPAHPDTGGTRGTVPGNVSCD